MQRFTIALFILSIILIFGNCKKGKEVVPKYITQELLNEGENLANILCISCHSPDPKMGDRLGPPLFAVKSHYLKKGVTEDKFVNAITSYVRHPKLKNTKMPGAVKKFGLMVGMPIPEEQLEKIALFMYYSDLSTPDWYTEHQKEEMLSYLQDLSAEEKELLRKGQDVALATQKVLGANLNNALSNGDVSDAMKFCSEKAISLTDSLSEAFNVGIKRVSNQYRNPDNAPDLDELQYILQSKKRMTMNEAIHPSLNYIDDQVVGYYPILTNAMCLQCHGNKQDISSDVRSQLESLYPEDKAIEYGINDLRGIWVVEIPLGKE